MELLSESYHLRLDHAALIFAYCGAISALPEGDASLVTAVRFLNGQEALSIVYSGAKYVRSALKIAAAQNHFFGWLKAEDSSTACGTSTLKSLLSLGPDAPHVHLRLRKRLSRYTLDCGLESVKKPRTAGLCGRAAGACDCGPVSCAFIERPSPSKNLA